MLAMVDIDRRRPSLATITTRTSGEGLAMFSCAQQQDVLEIDEITLEELLREDASISNTPPWLLETSATNKSWILINDNILEEEEEEEEKEKIDDEEELCDM